MLNWNNILVFFLIYSNIKAKMVVLQPSISLNISIKKLCNQLDAKKINLCQNEINFNPFNKFKLNSIEIVAEYYDVY